LLPLLVLPLLLFAAGAAICYYLQVLQHVNFKIINITAEVLQKSTCMKKIKNRNLAMMTIYDQYGSNMAFQKRQ